MHVLVKGWQIGYFDIRAEVTGGKAHSRLDVGTEFKF